MPQQLTLRVGLPDHACFDNYFSGRNAEAVRAVQALSDQVGGYVLLFGDHGAGKTHLLYAAQKQAISNDRQATYFSMSDTSVVQRLTSFTNHGEFVCVDDLQRVAGDARLEKIVFNLIEQQRQVNGTMLMAARGAPQAMSLVLPDLASRIASSATYRLHSLNDDEKEQAMRLRAHYRGFELSDDVIAYVMKRFPRDSGALFDLLDRIDQASLSRQRRITIPFIKELEDG